MTDLNRFIDAQDGYGFLNILEELRLGQKIGHWMWFVFPQIKGLGTSFKSQFYGINSLVEAKAYWEHPILGCRLQECLRAVLASEKSVFHIFGPIDELKLGSCITLFIEVVNDHPVLYKILEDLLNGQLDQRTINLIDQLKLD